MATSALSKRTSGIVTGVALGAIHLIALLAFWPKMFSWSGVLVAFVLYYATGAIGITFGFHRLLTHRSLKVVKPLEYFAAILGTLALQGGPIEWIATHRAHHANTDREGDPHDVHRGLRWSHMDWLYRFNESRLMPTEQLRLAPDLAADPFYRFMEKTYVLWTIALGVVLFLFGGWSWVIWGIFVRIVLTYHITWLVNSAAHHVGYQSFRTGDRSTNNWWVALLAWGEGWHNNHHAFPFSAKHGMQWFELDATYALIRVLATLKLAKDIKLPTPQMIARLTLTPQRQEPAA